MNKSNEHLPTDKVISCDTTNVIEQINQNVIFLLSMTGRRAAEKNIFFRLNKRVASELATTRLIGKT